LGSSGQAVAVVAIGVWFNTLALFWPGCRVVGTQHQD
jgi:hypothetical protein